MAKPIFVFKMAATDFSLLVYFSSHVLLLCTFCMAFASQKLASFRNVASIVNNCLMFLSTLGLPFSALKLDFCLPNFFLRNVSDWVINPPEFLT